MLALHRVRRQKRQRAKQVTVVSETERLRKLHQLGMATGSICGNRTIKLNPVIGPHIKPIGLRRLTPQWKYGSRWSNHRSHSLAGIAARSTIGYYDRHAYLITLLVHIPITPNLNIAISPGCDNSVSDLSSWRPHTITYLNKDRVDNLANQCVPLIMAVP